MSNVPAKFASAVILSVVVGAVAVALPSQRAKAADGCQTEPGDGTPQGKHWHYRTERGSDREPDTDLSSLPKLPPALPCARAALRSDRDKERENKSRR